jgi:hypothetical protein
MCRVPQPGDASWGSSRPEGTTTSLRHRHYWRTDKWLPARMSTATQFRCTRRRSDLTGRRASSARVAANTGFVKRRSPGSSAPSCRLRPCHRRHSTRLSHTRIRAGRGCTGSPALAHFRGTPGSRAHHRAERPRRQWCCSNRPLRGRRPTRRRKAARCPTTSPPMADRRLP